MPSILKPKTLQHLQAARKQEKKRHPFHSPGVKNKVYEKYARKQKKTRKAVADKLRGFRKEDPALARLWHRT